MFYNTLKTNIRNINGRLFPYITNEFVLLLSPYILFVLHRFVAPGSVAVAQEP